MASTAVIAAPMATNPWFTWRSLEQAREQLEISDASLNHEQCVFSNKNNTIVFKNGRRMAEVDGVTVWLNIAPEAVPGEKNWRLSAIDLDLLSLAIQAKATKTPKPLTVMIDAGHGGSDSGAVSKCRTLKEKDLNLDLALKTGKLLSKAGIKVLYTRTKDTTLSLAERCSAASKQRADLFVSIHANKASNTNANGIETFVLTPSGYPGTSANSSPRGWQIGNKNDYNSNLLGYSVQRALIKDSTTFDRGLKRQSFFVLRETYCPATLVEVGFLSNVEDLKEMKSTKWRNACARKLAIGVLDYCRKVDSLEEAVVAKREREAAASIRWKEYIAAKKTHQTEADLAPKPVAQQLTQTADQRPKPIAIETAIVKVEPSPSKPAQPVDLHEITTHSIQSTATNIYLAHDEKTNLNTESETGEKDLKSLMDFYEKGTIN